MRVTTITGAPADGLGLGGDPLAQAARGAAAVGVTGGGVDPVVDGEPVEEGAPGDGELVEGAAGVEACGRDEPPHAASARVVTTRRRSAWEDVRGKSAMRALVA
ncbi:MAG: hypothetical protein WCB85_08060 [Candidatus Dormiibacterota bacterium]